MGHATLATVLPWMRWPGVLGLIPGSPWEGTGTYYASARKELGPMGRTRKGLLGAPRVPTGRRFIVLPSSSSLGPQF